MFQTRRRRDWSVCRPANWKRVATSWRSDAWPMRIHRPRSSGGEPKARAWPRWPASVRRCCSRRSIGITRPFTSARRPTPRVKAARSLFKCPSTVSAVGLVSTPSRRVSLPRTRGQSSSSQSNPRLTLFAPETELVSGLSL